MCLTIFSPDIWTGEGFLKWFEDLFGYTGNLHTVHGVRLCIVYHRVTSRPPTETDTLSIPTHTRPNKLVNRYVPAWDARKETVLKEVMPRKFEQSRSLRDELLSTGDNTLVECTADGFWGAGCSIDSRHLDNHSFKGRNTTGVTISSSP